MGWHSAHIRALSKRHIYLDIYIYISAPGLTPGHYFLSAATKEPRLPLLSLMRADFAVGDGTAGQ